MAQPSLIGPPRTSAISWVEHVNVTVPDQAEATFFYVNGLGFTRDPYIDFGPFNVWINVGAQQFHLPTRDLRSCAATLPWSYRTWMNWRSPFPDRRTVL